MKRFLIYLAVIVVMVATGFTIFVLVRDNEYMSLPTSTIYMNVGDSIEVDFVHQHAKRSTKITIDTNNSAMLSYDKDTNKFTAGNIAGKASIIYRTNNPRFGTLTCNVIIGDGKSENTPYYIKDLNDLANIGTPKTMGTEGAVKGYVLDPEGYYSLMADISVNDISENNPTTYWVPLCMDIEKGFTGTFDGNGHIISNMTIDATKYNDYEGVTDKTFENVGLFSKLGTGAVVEDLILENVTINGTYNNAGSVAGINDGTIERVRVQNRMSNDIETVPGFTVSNYTNGNLGGLVGTNNNRIDRSSVIINTLGNEEDRLAGHIGGLVGENKAGIIINSFARQNASTGVSTVYLVNSSETLFGGIVGANTTTDKDNRARIKDVYSVVNVNAEGATKVGMIAAQVTLNGNDASDYIYGAYYNKDAANSYTAFNGSDDSTFEDTTSTMYKSYIATSLTTADMADYTKYISHKDENNNAVRWAFEDQVWGLSSTVNGGYPYLFTTSRQVADDIEDGTTVENGEVSGMLQFGSYIITEEIEIDEETWPFFDMEFGGSIEMREGGAFVGKEDVTYTKPLFKSLRKGAELKNVKVKNYNYASDASSNEYSILCGSNSGLIQNAVIENCTMTINTAILDENGASPASVYAGFVAASNHGSIRYTTVTASTIQVVNYREIEYSEPDTDVEPTKYNVANQFDRTVYAGFIVGYNDAELGNAQVINSSSLELDNNHREEQLIGTTKYSDRLTAYFGGIAGDNNGTITLVAVGNSSINATYTDERKVAGGIVGTQDGLAGEVTLYSGKDVYTNSIRRSGIMNTDVVGYYAAGLIGRQDVAGETKYIRVKSDWGVWNDQTTHSYVGDKGRYEVTFDVIGCYVEGGTITGRYAAGFVSYARISGAYFDCYATKTTIKGASSISNGDNSVVAGYVAAVETNIYQIDKNNNRFDNTVFEGCYTNVTLQGNGSKFAVADGENIFTMPTAQLNWIGLFNKKDSILVIDSLFNDNCGGKVSGDNRNNSKTTEEALMVKSSTTVPDAFYEENIANGASMWDYEVGYTPRIYNAYYLNEEGYFFQY